MNAEGLKEREIQWSMAASGLCYYAVLGPLSLAICIGDFPMEPMYVLHWALNISTRGSLKFDDWPASWSRPKDELIMDLSKKTSAELKDIEIGAFARLDAASKSEMAAAEAFVARVQQARLEAIRRERVAREAEAERMCQCAVMPSIGKVGSAEVLPAYIDTSRCPVHSGTEGLAHPHERRLIAHDEAIGVLTTRLDGIVATLDGVDHVTDDIGDRLETLEKKVGGLTALCEGPRGMWGRVDALETERGFDHERINGLVQRADGLAAGHRGTVASQEEHAKKVDSLSKMFDGLCKLNDQQEEAMRTVQAKLSGIEAALDLNQASAEIGRLLERVTALERRTPFIFGGAGGAGGPIVGTRMGSPLDNWRAADELKKAALGVDPNAKMEQPEARSFMPAERALILQRIADEAKALMATDANTKERAKHWGDLSRTLHDLQVPHGPMPGEDSWAAPLPFPDGPEQGGVGSSEGL